MRRLLGALLTISGFVVGTVSLVTFFRTQADLGAPMSRNMARTFLVLLGASVATFLVRFGQRLAAPTAAELLRRDRRPPILFLRRFTRDHAELTRGFSVLGFWVRRFFTGESAPLEATLVRRLGRHGPGIAVARPGERVPPLGFARVWVGGGDWKATVREFLGKSQLVVILMDEVPDREEGLGWEVATVLQEADPRRVVLVVTPGSDPKRIWRNWGQAFGAILADAPDDDTLYVTFAGNWRPRFHNAPRRHEADYLRLLDRIMPLDEAGRLVARQAHAPAREAGPPRDPGPEVWYYDDGINARCGPIGEATLKRLHAWGMIGDDDLIWKEPMAQWCRFRDVFDPDEELAARRPGD